MAELLAKMTWGWFGEYKREDGVCVPCTPLSFYEANGDLKPWASNIQTVNQFSGTSKTPSTWTSEDHENAIITYEDPAIPDVLRGDRLTALKLNQSITELRCGVPYSITKKVRLTSTNIPNFVVANLTTADAGRAVECEDCSDVPDCVC
jgi:hypothetical protein